MIVDDGEIFDPPPVDTGPDNFLEAMRAVHSSGAGRNQGPISETNIRLLDEMASRSWPPEDAASGDVDMLTVLDKAGHRRRAGILSQHEGNVALWATQGYQGPIGPHARSGPVLSPACRGRMLHSLEQDAPAQVLDEIRALARRSEHDGISAWRAYREKQKLAEQSTAGGETLSRKG